ncbi:GNAT family N-acetyltransferase [Pseudoponticoccus marisrubri]|uniref:Acetyltransferase n=1 Tax=Pseudoponticoccus marisrubri TaxID=1685382 RepID=A0A0W7WIT2_9RHOB|nr:GNAT family N-acetyltransferase [Pseudoponticoccus marisrubri]KUF10462.1 acetyltransferase [Pseudoponticoccus marisrubri]
MTAPDLPRLFATLDATWPAATQVSAGPWCLREGRGGGKRVSATTARGPWRDDDLGAAETAMRLMGQPALFMIRPGDEDLDRALDRAGYDLIDPVNLWLCPIDRLTDRRLPPVTAFTIWEPLAIMRELWEAGGIDAARQNVMERTAPPKTGLFGRVSDKPAGVGFCALHDGIAMVHALEIAPQHRAKGLGAWMMRCAAHWALRKGARWMSVQATEANVAANGLYAALQMEKVGGYHYRILQPAESEDT